MVDILKEAKQQVSGDLYELAEMARTMHMEKGIVGLCENSMFVWLHSLLHFGGGESNLNVHVRVHCTYRILQQ